MSSDLSMIGTKFKENALASVDTMNAILKKSIETANNATEKLV